MSFITLYNSLHEPLLRDNVTGFEIKSRIVLSVRRWWLVDDHGGGRRMMVVNHGGPWRRIRAAVAAETRNAAAAARTAGEVAAHSEMFTNQPLYLKALYSL